MWLWLPTENSGRYAYMEQVTSVSATEDVIEDDDEGEDDAVDVADDDVVEQGIQRGGPSEGIER